MSITILFRCVSNPIKFKSTLLVIFSKKLSKGLTDIKRYDIIPSNRFKVGTV